MPRPAFLDAAARPAETSTVPYKIEHGQLPAMFAKEVNVPWYKRPSQRVEACLAEIVRNIRLV